MKRKSHDTTTITAEVMAHILRAEKVPAQDIDARIEELKQVRLMRTYDRDGRELHPDLIKFLTEAKKHPESLKSLPAFLKVLKAFMLYLPGTFLVTPGAAVEKTEVVHDKAGVHGKAYYEHPIHIQVLQGDDALNCTLYLASAIDQSR